MGSNWTKTVNIFFPLTLVYLVLLATGVIPFTALAVVIGILLANSEISFSW